MAKRIGWIVVAMVLLFSCLWLAGHASVQAKEEMNGDATQLLSRVLQNQEKMMGDLEIIKQELKRIRIRTN